MVRDRIELVAAARDAGMDLVSTGQHFCPIHDLYPQPIPLLARLAAKAPEMMMQTGVLLGPFYHPVMLAEEMATMAAVCTGGFRAPIGLAYREEEFAMFGQRKVDRVRRTVELVETTRRLLAGETVTTEGGFYPLTDVALAPGTVDGTPPAIFLGTGTERGARRAGRLADGIYTTGYLPKSEVRQLTAAFREASGPGPTKTVVIRREVTLASTRQEALARAASGWQATLRSYMSAGLEQSSLGRVVRDLESDRDSSDLPFVVGSPEECAEEIEEYARMGVDEMVVRFQTYGATRHDTIALIEQFGAAVIPLVRGKIDRPALRPNGGDRGLSVSGRSGMES
jgi:alkanesulfonate monooxygenase SsuD/methylene tetrahydromethanopterin reductase-like flavin-dependent oxidoreductase (luciferase family)